MDDVYVAGSVKANATAPSLPTYWKNGIPVPLKDMANNETTGEVKAITVSGGDVYVVGILNNTPKNIILWINGVPRYVTNSKYYCTPSGIAVSATGDIYISGLEENTNFAIAHYWKLSKTSAILGEPYPFSTTSSLATGIALSGDDVYVSGYLFNGGSSAAIYWKKPAGQPAVGIPLGTAGSIARSIAVAGDNVYISGYEAGTAKYWTNNQNTSTILGTTGNSAANLIAVSGGNVYIAGYDKPGASANYIATYWTNTIGGTTPAAISLTDGSKNNNLKGLSVVGNNVYVSGSDDNNTAYLWKNGKLVAPFDGTNTTIRVNAVYAVKK